MLGIEYLFKHNHLLCIENIYNEYRRVIEMKVVIIGGVAAGATTAARLRRLNKDVEIIMFEKAIMFLMLIVDCLIMCLEKFVKKVIYC